MTRNGVANNDGGAEPRQRDTPGILGADPVIPPGEGGGTITSPSILACQCKDGMFSKLHKPLIISWFIPLEACRNGANMA